MGLHYVIKLKIFYTQLVGDSVGHLVDQGKWLITTFHYKKASFYLQKKFIDKKL